MVLDGPDLVDMVLELDDVRVGNNVGIDRAQDGSRSFVDRLGTDRRLGNSRDGKSDYRPHSDDWGRWRGVRTDGSGEVIFTQTLNVGLPATLTQKTTGSCFGDER